MASSALADGATQMVAMRLERIHSVSRTSDSGRKRGLLPGFWHGSMPSLSSSRHPKVTRSVEPAELPAK